MSDIRPDKRDRKDFVGVVDASCSWPGVVVEVVVVAFSVDLDGVLDELCRRLDRNEGMRDELRAFGWSPSSKQAPLRPYRPYT